MKKALFYLTVLAISGCLMMSSLWCSAQVIKKTRKVISLMTPQDYYLNGGFRASMGGKSRITIPVHLPPNTVEWYYTFTTGQGSSGAAMLDLVGQLSRLYDHSGLTAMAVSALISPDGARACDVFLMDQENSDAFEQKRDQNGGTFSYYRSGRRENIRNGTVQISDLTKGTVYLGFKNPSTTEAITIKVEIAAIVEEVQTDNTTWATETKQGFYTLIYDNCIKKNVPDDIAKGMAACLIEKLEQAKTPEQYNALSEFERGQLFQELTKSCAQKFEPKKSPEQEKAISYGTMGWKAYLAGDIDKCMEFSKKALSIDAHMGWVKSNLALCYLIRQDEATATDLYVDALTEYKKETTSSLIKRAIQASIDDLDQALVKYPNLKGSKYIKELFENELQKN